MSPVILQVNTPSSAVVVTLLSLTSRRPWESKPLFLSHPRSSDVGGNWKRNNQKLAIYSKGKCYRSLRIAPGSQLCLPLLTHNHTRVYFLCFHTGLSSRLQFSPSSLLRLCRTSKMLVLAIHSKLQLLHTENNMPLSIGH